MTNAVAEVTSSSSAGVGTVLLPVIVGGVIGLLGSILVPWVQDKIDRNRQRRQKLETLRSYIGEIRYYAVWSKTAATFINEFKSKFAELPKITAIARQEFVPVCAKDESGLKADLMPALQAHFRTEFINRIDEVIAFRSLGASEIKEILDTMLSEIAGSLTAKHGKTLRFTVNALDAIISQGYSAEFGVRHLRRVVETLIEIPLSRMILSGELKNQTCVFAVEKEGGVVLKTDNPQ